jgi:hypothetical protein
VGRPKTALRAGVSINRPNKLLAIRMELLALIPVAVLGLLFWVAKHT